MATLQVALKAIFTQMINSLASLYGATCGLADK